MSGLNESQQYTTCESARQHFHQLKTGQWEGSWSRFPKRPILAYLRINLQDVKLIHKQVLHKCEMSKDLITNRVNSPIRGPLCLQNGKQQPGKQIVITHQAQELILIKPSRHACGGEHTGGGTFQCVLRRRAWSPHLPIPPQRCTGG